MQEASNDDIIIEMSVSQEHTIKNKAVKQFDMAYLKQAQKQQQFYDSL